MGMDSYVYIQDKNTFDAETLYRKEHENKVQAYYDFLLKMGEKYPSLKGHISEYGLVEATLSGEDRQEYDRLFNICVEDKFPHDDETTCELQYWRKPYPLHRYIVKHFLGDGEDDNCVNIPLSKDGVQKMLESMTNCLGRFSHCKEETDDFYKCDYYDDDNLKADIIFFTGLLDKFNDDVVIYYYTWY